MKKILVPTDFCNCAENAYDLACEVANESGGVVTLLHVLEYPVTSIFNTTGEISMDSITDVYLLNLKEKAESELNKKLRHPSFPRVKIEKKLLIGSAYENMSSQIKQIDADLVIMGTMGASGLKEIFIGSNAEKVVRYSKCPVIVVPAEFKLGRIKKIAYGITLDEDHSGPLLELKKYLDIFKAELHLVWIDSLYTHDSEEEAVRKIEEIADLQMLQNYSVNCYRSVSADDGLLYYAEENAIDMIAMATHSRKGLAHLFVGSFTEDVVNHSSRPVWTMTLGKLKKKKRKHEFAKHHQ